MTSYAVVVQNALKCYLHPQCPNFKFCIFTVSESIQFNISMGVNRGREGECPAFKSKITTSESFLFYE